ncbi:MAG: lysine--tRNA ligase [Candidatus Micrarchaeota archaeon]|nr:lysine--tRNA ligase [Candidatus Micrarchaeota archaeon]
MAKVHWADQAAEKLLKNESNIVASGTSISGKPHIGNANDVIRAGIIVEATKQAGGRADLVWVSDNMDPMRRVPEGLPKEFEEYMGMPYSDIPDLEGCHASFAEHYEKILLDEVGAAGAFPMVFNGRDMYRSGMYDNAIRTAIEKRAEIKAILDRFREHPLPADWFPFNPICSNCGRVATPKVTGYADGKISYACADAVVGKGENPVKGCGNEGTADFHEGKLVWRVEWPARWKFLEVTCEPFGKEHAAAGGSWDTGKLISEQIYGYPAPLPIIYEHFQVGGQKMSKSIGNVVTVGDWLECAPPETLRYYLFAGDINVAKDMDITTVMPHVMEEYQRVERIYFGRAREGEAPKEEEAAGKLKRIYELSQLKCVAPKEMPAQVPYGFAALLAQVAPSREKKIEVLKRTGHFDEKLADAIMDFVERAGFWARKYKAEGYVVEFAGAAEAKKALGAEKAATVKAFAAAYEKKDLRDAVKACAAATGKSDKEVFAAVYLALFAKEKGPRLASLEDAVGKEKLLKILKEAVS